MGFIPEGGSTLWLSREQKITYPLSVLYFPSSAFSRLSPFPFYFFHQQIACPLVDTLSWEKYSPFLRLFFPPFFSVRDFTVVSVLVFCFFYFIVLIEKKTLPAPPPSFTTNRHPCNQLNRAFTVVHEDNLSIGASPVFFLRGLGGQEGRRGPIP